MIYNSEVSESINLLNIFSTSIDSMLIYGFSVYGEEATKQTLDMNEPSQQLLSSLLEHFQSGRMHEAEKLAVFITNEFPNHQYAWKVLGAVFGVTGRKSEAEDVNRKAVALSPEDAAAHNNLGITHFKN